MCVETLSIPAWTGEKRLRRLMELLDVNDNSFWRTHYTFAESTPQGHALLGLSRRRDIIMNSLIPLMMLYADVFEKKLLHARALETACAIGLMEENGILLRMEKQLLKGKIAVTRGMQQQGLLELYKTFCLTERCSQCAIPPSAL
jgi:hypothetical protein